MSVVLIDHDAGAGDLAPRQRRLRTRGACRRLCVPWFGHWTGNGYAVAGNMLTGEDVVAAMADAYEASVGQPFPERLVLALEAGQAAGGDKRGRQSAALKVMETEDYPLIDPNFLLRLQSASEGKV